MLNLVKNSSHKPIGSENHNISQVKFLKNRV